MTTTREPLSSNLLVSMLMRLSRETLARCAADGCAECRASLRAKEGA